MPELRENSIDGFLRLGHRLFFCPCQGFQSWSGEQEVGQHGSAGMPAKDGGQLVGIISIGDVLKHRLGELQVEAEVLRDCGAPVETDPLNREKPNVSAYIFFSRVGRGIPYAASLLAIRFGRCGGYVSGESWSGEGTADY
jgi:hypothetical protein